MIPSELHCFSQLFVETLPLWWQSSAALTLWTVDHGPERDLEHILNHSTVKHGRKIKVEKSLTVWGSGAEHNVWQEDCEQLVDLDETGHFACLQTAEHLRVLSRCACAYTFNMLTSPGATLSLSDYVSFQADLSGYFC